MIAVLDAEPGAVVSHRSAAALWRLPGFSVGVVEVSRQRGRSGNAAHGARLHRPTVLGPHHVTNRHGIPVTTLARTLFDLAATVHPARMERLVQNVVSKSPSALPTLHQLLGDLAGSGRSGVAVMRVILDDLPDGCVAVASGLEAQFERILTRAGEAPLERQIEVGGHEWIGRVDFLDRELRIVVEVDSDLHHTSPLDRAHDLRRDEALVAAGWNEVVRVSEDEVWRHPHVAIEKVRDARARARRPSPHVLAPETHHGRFVSGART